MLTDTSQELTGTQIECLFKGINVQDIDPFNTKMEASVRNNWHEPYAYVKHKEAPADATDECDYGAAATQMVSSLIMQGGLSGHLSGVISWRHISMLPEPK